MSDFIAYALKSLAQSVKPALQSKFDKTPNEFDSFQDVLNLYDGGFPMPEGLFKDVGDKIPLTMFKEIFRTDGERFLKFPVPQVIKGMSLYTLYSNAPMHILNTHVRSNPYYRYSFSHMYLFN